MTRCAAKVIRCVDADTCVVSVAFDVPLLNIRGEVTRYLRIFGVNAPELKTPAGKAAKSFVEALVAKAKVIEVEPVKASDDFGRLIGVLWLDGESLARLLLDGGHAVPFRGVAKPED